MSVVTSEEEMINGCVKGNRRCQELLYLKFSRKMMGVCFRYTRAQEEAEDVLQESFIRIFKKIDQFRFEGSLEGWIRRVVLNTVFDHLRKQNIMIALSDINEYEELETGEDLFPDVDLDLLINAIRELSPGYRAVFNMFAIEGYSHKEISAILGISVGTSKSQYAAARRVLQKKLKVYAPTSKMK
jgi:RNA polymerase sigma-70 factor (ECF subfamily)